MSSAYTDPIAHTDIKALRPGGGPTRKAGDKPQSQSRLRTKPGTRAGNFVARRYRVHPAFADLIATLAGLGSEAST